MSSVMAIGAGLVSGRTNVQNDFTVYTNREGFGGLSVGIDGPSRADIRYHDNHDGTVKVTYTPYTAGAYKLTVKYDGIHVRGSPFEVRVRGDEPSISYTSTSSPTFDRWGERRVGGMHPGVSRVRVSGRGLYSGIRNVQNEINIDVRDAGPGRLHWSIEGPGHVESKNHGMEEGIYRLFYRPDSAGNYTIKIKYGDKELLGSPYIVRIV